MVSMCDRYGCGVCAVYVQVVVYVQCVSMHSVVNVCVYACVALV